jgi:hypothetical protein
MIEENYLNNLNKRQFRTQKTKIYSKQQNFIS